MTAVRYIGPHDEVVLPDHGVSCARGGTCEVAAEVAESLVAQTTWELAKSKPAPAPPADDPKETST